MVAIVVTELLICLKFGWNTITKPLPKHIAIWWVVGCCLLVGYTVIKFYCSNRTRFPGRRKSW